MSDDFKIYIDRLKEGATQKVGGEFAPDFLDVNEAELRFEQMVRLRAEAYVADDHLVVHLDAAAVATIPCAICNSMFGYELTAKNVYHTEPLAEIRSAVFDLGPLLREALLTELPYTAECSGGRCPQREALASYMRSEKKEEKTTYFPFADIE
jgi:uncharacterized metal-binding protein YceD (DUF177 family)